MIKDHAQGQGQGHWVMKYAASIGLHVDVTA